MARIRSLSQDLAAGLILLGASALAPGAHGQGPPVIDGCAVFPSDNIWNTPIDSLPPHPLSDDYMASIGLGGHVHPDFGSGLWAGGPIGIPYTTVPGDQPTVSVSFTYDDESDPSPYPIPPDPPIEGGPGSSGDRHVLVLDRDRCVLHELYAAYPNGDGSWDAGSGARFDLSSHALRPDTWTSADAAGLPILPGLVRYDEVEAGAVLHALRFTVPSTQRLYVWPARHYASSDTDPSLPPMGLRVRLKASFDISGYPPRIQTIMTGLKVYGMMLADNGSAWYISGVPDERWDNDELRLLRDIAGSDFEAVDVSSLMVDPDSGQVAGVAVDPPNPVGPIQVVKTSLSDLSVVWSDSSVDASHSAAADYEVHRSFSAGAGYAAMAVVPNSALNPEQASDAGGLGSTPPLAPLHFYRVSASNSGGDSGDVPPP